MQFWELIITVVITIVGWYIAYFFGKKQDAANKRKEMRVNYLIEAYRLIESAANRENNNKLKNLESAIADIQLFGTQTQILLSQKIVEIFVQQNSADFDCLLKNLREELRKELDLEKVDGRLLHFRIVEKKH
ncbi:MAG: hypothetical protein LBT25_07560 [Candidatus Symbiothrix sp.]|jgi:flagellar basal body-associated protein FliL|nr:hypothetical protein [Candidatus Symbiothrix sp.]